MPKTQEFPAVATRAGGVARRMGRLQFLAPAGRILGVDPGLVTTGYGIVDVAGRAEPVLVEAGTLKARATDALPDRLMALHKGLLEVLTEHRPDVVVIEELFSTYAHPRSALLMAHARGVLMLAAGESGAAVHAFSPNEVKQVVSGNGHATKAAMQAAVRRRLNLAEAPEPHDVADALALALCFAARQRVEG